MQEAETSGKHVLVFATADWCPPCRDMRRGPLQADSVNQLIDERFVPVKSDQSQRSSPGYDISIQLELYNLPSFVMLDAQGNELKRLVGSVTTDQFERWLSDVPEAPAQLRNVANPIGLW